MVNNEKKVLLGYLFWVLVQNMWFAMSNDFSSCLPTQRFHEAWVKKTGIFKWSSILQLQLWDSREITVWAEIAFFPLPFNLSFHWIWKSYLSLSGSRTWEERLSEFSAKQHVQITALIPLNCSPREGGREEKTKRNFSTDGYLLFFPPYLSLATKITLKTNRAAFISG